MASPAVAHERRQPGEQKATSGFVVGTAFALLALTLVLSTIAPTGIAWLRAAGLIFTSLLVQAIPFVMLGAFVSSAIEVFVPTTAVDRVGSLPRPLQIPAAALAGIAFPICECGSIPVARRLMQKGLAPSAAIAFMLSAPVANPVVVLSTFVAYNGRGPVWLMVIGRVALGLLVAVVTGWVLIGTTKDQLLRSIPDREAEPIVLQAPESRWRLLLGHLGNEFLFMGRYLILGAAIAALVQTFLPQQLIGGVASVLILDIVAMMVFAFLVSLCSESDAFVAASFTQFGPGPQLAFLVLGPMLDLKLGSLYLGSFNRHGVLAIALATSTTILVACVWITVVFG